jgi:catechol 2,3-dioxygenase-like lactoylglutathione lyase family enzyme
MSSGSTTGLNAVTNLKEDVVSDTATISISKLGTVIIPTADQDQALDFYVGKLGFEKRADVPFGGAYRWVEVAPAGAATTIALAPPPPDGEAPGGRETGIALHTEDADAVHAALKERGVDVDADVSRMGDPVPPMFWFRDPEKNSLLVVQTA